MVIVKVTLLWIVTIATRWLDTPKFKKTILGNLFIPIKTSCCHKICSKCPVLSKIAFNFTFNISGLGTLIPNIISLYALNHNLKYYLELLHDGCVKRYFFVTDNHYLDKIQKIIIILFI